MKRTLRRGMLRLTFQVLRRVSPRKEVAGVEILLLGSPPNPSGCFDTVAEAIACVQRLDARRWSLMAAHFKGIGVVQHGASQFIPGLSACILSTATLGKGPVHSAAVMVHELAHARLFACGFSYAPATRGREEMICVREAVRFLNRAPEGRPVAEAYAVQAAREFAAPLPWYAEPSRQQERKNTMTFYGVPRWLQKLRIWLME